MFIFVRLTIVLPGTIIVASDIFSSIIVADDILNVCVSAQCDGQWRVGPAPIVPEIVRSATNVCFGASPICPLYVHVYGTILLQRR